MRLLPAVLVIIAVFLLALLFLQGRKAYPRVNTVAALPAVLFLLLAGLAFIFFGKIALFLSLIGLALFILMRKYS